ncbi:MAG: hypothetical protein IJN26_07130 [Bacteroidales bacterium]|nr:hypothetical protein [Bacteroidales bacterium]
MKRLLLLLVCGFITIAASAQYAVQNVPVLKGSRVFVDGEKISNADVVAYLASAYDDSVADSWTKNRTAYKTGLGLTIAGSAVTWCGSLVFTAGIIAGAGTLITVPILGMGGIVAGDMQPAGDYLDGGLSAADLMISIGGCSALTGLAMLASGIPVLCVYKTRLKTMFQEYGPGLSSDINLSFGPTGNGIGLALNF